MANTTVSTTNFETMALKSVMATILETGTMCNMIPSLACVSFDKDHHEEIVAIVKKLNDAKSKEDLEAAYKEYFLIGIKAGAPIHEILMAIHSRTQINNKFHFDTKKWIEESMYVTMEHPEDDEPEAEEAAPAEPAKAEPKKDESKKDPKPEPAKPAEKKPAEPKKDSKPAEPKKDSKPAQNAEPVKPAEPTEPKKTSTFQATEPVEGSAANKLGFDISKFIKPEMARQATVVPSPAVKPAEPQQTTNAQQPAAPVATAPAEPAKPAEPVDPKKAEEELKKKVEEMNKNFHLIKGTHPGFTLEQVNSLLMLAKNGFIKNKMKECDAKDRPNNPQFYEIPLAPYETDENKGKFDICFKLNTKDKKHPIIILYNTRPTFEKSINANINNMETFRA